MAFNRKKQLFAPAVEALVKELTGFEENERNFQEVLSYFFQNIIHHNFLSVDHGSVQRSLEGLVDKFNLHGLRGRGKRLQELIERYVAANLSEHSELQWNVLLLLLRLSYKPTSVPEELLSVKKPTIQPLEEDEEVINWPEYLQEGLEDFNCPNNDSVIWSDEEEIQEYEQYGESAPCDSKRTICTFPSYRGVPHPALWGKKLQSPTKQEVVRSLTREGMKSEQWLRCHIQPAWWSDPFYRGCPESKHTSANACEMWEKHSQKNQPESRLLVISEDKVLKEVLWMLQIPTDTSIFVKNHKGCYSVKPGVSLISTIPGSLGLDFFCSSFSMIRELKEFEGTLNSLELSQTPPPLTFKAYCAELMKQLHSFNNCVVNIEARLNKQEETMTLLSVGEELSASLKKLQYLYDIHTRGTSGWWSSPAWLQVTRLLSVLYEAFLEANDRVSVELSLTLFVHSFHVYMDIIDLWLSEGRLEDWRGEFVVIKQDEHMEVMPYEEEMHKIGVVPLTLLTKLVKVVKDAGFIMEIVSQLNKLTDLRDTVQNKGCLFREFVDNINSELSRVKGLMISTPTASATITPTESKSVCDSKPLVQPSESKVLTEMSSASPVERFGLISAGDQSVLKGYATFAKCGDEEALPKRHLSTTSTRTLYQQTMITFLSNPLLGEALKDYCHISDTSPTPPNEGLLIDSMTLMGVACLHRVLQWQVGLVHDRLQIASRLVMDTVCHEYNLLRHFSVLRNVFFMESGILAQRFYTYFFKEIMVMKWRNCVNLTVHLQDCVAEMFPGFQHHISVHISRVKAADPIQEAIQSFSIAYTVDWPVSIVVSDEAINSYNKVFQFLLHLKYAFWVLQGIHFSDLSGRSNSLMARRLQVLKTWMYHSTNTLHSYFMGLVLRRYAADLDHSIACANSITDIIDAHTQYLFEVKTHCLQLKKSHLENYIMKLVWQCQDLADLWMMESSGKLTDSDIRKLELQYSQAYMGVTCCLEAITFDMDDQLNPLCELKAEFLHSVPKLWLENIHSKIN